MSHYGRFTRLNDLKNHVNKKVNLLGVVLEFSIPRHTNGSDCLSVLKIVDESQQKPEVSVNIFVESLSLLPHIESHADLILLERVLITTYNGEVYALFNKKYSSFAIFRRRGLRFYTPYQVFRLNATPVKDYDKYSFDALRNWSLSFDFDSGTSDYLSPLKEIKAGNSFDLVCKVIHIGQDSNGDWMLFVWDGTDTPSLSLDMKLEDEEHQPLPLHIESQPLPRSISCTFPSLGSVLRVTVDQVFERLDLHFKGDNKWVRIRHMQCEMHSGLWKGLLLPSSKIRILPDDDKIVNERERDFAERQREMGWLPMCYSISSYSPTFLCYQSSHPFASLLDVLNHLQGDIVHKCIARVVACYPCQANGLCSLIGSCEYKLRLTLEDPTARLHVYVCSKEKVKFLEDDLCDDILISKMNKLLGMPEDYNVDEVGNYPRDPPWIQCYIRCCDSEYYICYTKLVT